MKNNIEFTATSYTRKIRTFSAGIRFKRNNRLCFGAILYFIKVERINPRNRENYLTNYYVVVRHLNITRSRIDNNFKLNSFFICQESDLYTILDVSNNFSICCFIQLSDERHIYVMVPTKIIKSRVNFLEKD